jgi:hypothetical protein
VVIEHVIKIATGTVKKKRVMTIKKFYKYNTMYSMNKCTKIV